MPLRVDRQKLRRQRQLRGYSGPGFAQALSVSNSHVYRIEWGKRNPSPRLYRRMTRLLGVEPEDLLLPETGWTCPNCGTSDNSGDHCASCGSGKRCRAEQGTDQPGGAAA